MSESSQSSSWIKIVGVVAVVIVIGFLLLLVARGCGTSSSQLPADVTATPGGSVALPIATPPTTVPSTSIQNIVWQWTTLTAISSDMRG